MLNEVLLTVATGGKAHSSEISDRKAMVADARTHQRKLFLGIALKSAVVAIAGIVALAIKHGLLPEPRASIWKPIGDAVVEAVPYAGELVVLIALLVCLISILLAFSPCVTRRYLRRTKGVADSS